MLDENIDNLMKNVPEAYQHDSARISTVSDYNCVGKIKSVNGFCNLTWGCMTLIYICDPLKNTWEDILENLTELYFELRARRKQAAY